MILRVYDPSECDVHGVPLDWERCRVCDGTGQQEIQDARPYAATCDRCDGHGSLKAAALASRLMRFRGAVAIPAAEIGHRCESCSHPMSEGTWEDGTWPRVEDGPGTLRWAFEHLRRGNEPPRNLSSDEPLIHRTFAVHYSPCDEGCRHHPLSDCRAAHDGEVHPYSEWSWENAYSTWPREASWRPVDIRTLGWPHDLRPERLSCLCLRCFAERTSVTREHVEIKG